MASSRLGRRDLLKGLCIGVLGATVAACAPKVVKETVIVEGTPKVVKETIIVEGTPVEREVTVVVTKVVEKVVTKAVPALAEKRRITINHFGGSSREDSDKHHLWPLLRERFPELEMVNNWISYDGWKQKIPVMIASGDIADMQITHFLNNVPTMMDGGLIAETGPLLQQYGQHILAATDEAAWESSVYDGKQYAATHQLYDLNVFVPGYRGDWLENVGLGEPKTIDEYTEALRAFTFDDPNKSGVKDTWGRLLYTNIRADEDIFQAFGVGAGTHHEGPWSRRGDRIELDWVQPEMKEALIYMRQVWADGLFHPDSITIPMGQRLSTYDAGTTGNAHVGYDGHDAQNIKFKDLGPEAYQILGEPLKGPKGHQGVTGRGFPWGYVVSESCETPEDVIRILDYIFSPEIAGTLICQGVNGITNKGLNEKGWVDEFTTEERIAMGDEWKERQTRATGIDFWTGIHQGALRPWLLRTFPDDMRKHFEGVLARRYSPEALKGMEYCLKYTINTAKGHPVPADIEYWGILQSRFGEFISQIVAGTLDADSGWEEWLKFCEENGLPEITKQANEG